MARVRRFESGSLAKPIRRADGTLVADAIITRTGVMTYRNADGSERREYRPPTAHDDAMLSSFKLVPLTDDHPPQMIDSQNARQFAVGAVGENVRRDGNRVAATIAVYDASTISKMDQDGKTYLSCGYDCDLIDSPGVTPDGERYDAVQANIIGNHLALVHNPRAGKEAAVRMDGAYSTTDFEPHESGKSQPRKDAYMNLEQALAALAAAQEKIGAEKSRADGIATERDAAIKERDALKARLDDASEKLVKAEKDRKDAIDGEPARVKARVALETKCATLGLKRADGAELEFTGLSDRAIKLAAIKHVTNVDCDVDTSGTKRSDEYVNARYDAAMERAVDSSDTFRRAHDVLETHRADNVDAAEKQTEKARQDMLEANRNGWRNPSNVAK
jgi:hypothetical protein